MEQRDSPIQLTILPEHQVIEVVPPTTLMGALADAGIGLTAPCAGQGTCGKCLVQVAHSEAEQGSGVESLSPPTGLEHELLTTSRLSAGFRIACQAQVRSDITVDIPPTSRASEMRILLGGASRKVTFEPSIVKTFVSLPPQKLEGALSEVDLLKDVLDLRADLRADYAVLSGLPIILQQRAPQMAAPTNRELTVITREDQIIALEPGDTTDGGYGLALDVGTTTVVGALIDLSTGKDLAVASAVNGQMQHGHDVIARIKFSTETEDGLGKLQDAARTAVNQILMKVTESARIPTGQIYEIAAVGNTTMSHLLLGISPQSLGHLPYVPVFSSALNVPAVDLDFKVNPKANVHLLPNIAGFVGADTVGAILAAGFDQPDGRTRMLADIGTNCEIVLRRGDDLFACSTPAGPAFEGAKIHHGMYAGDGAIEQVRFDEGDCTHKVIGHSPPQGICGSGLVDIGAELLRVGIVDSTGQMLPPAELPKELPQTLKERVIEREGQTEFVIATVANEEPITLTQRDMRELQLAKAAIRSGIEVLLQHTGLSVGGLDELCIAGGFGSYLNKDNAIRLGLIPDMPRDRIRILGNAAIGGAKLALISQEMRRCAEIVACQAQHLQIAETPDFQTQFIEAMIFE